MTRIVQMKIQAFMHNYILKQLLWVRFENVCPVVQEELSWQDFFPIYSPKGVGGQRGITYINNALVHIPAFMQSYKPTQVL